MKKIINRSLISLFIILLGFIIFLSTVGIKTNKLNTQISNKIKNIDEKLEIQIKNVNIVLDLFKFKINVKTIGPKLKYKNKTIKLQNIKSNISIKSLLNNQFSIRQLSISTKSIEIRDLISFIREINNNPQFYIAERFIKKGYLIADINVEFDEKGNIIENYNIKGFIKDGRVNFFKKYDLNKIDLIFYLNKDNFKFRDIKLSLNKNDLLIPEVSVKKEKDKYLISGKINNNKILLDENNISNFIDPNFFDINIKKIEFKSENTFSFLIDSKYNFENIKVNSNIKLDKFVILNQLNLASIFPKTKKNLSFLNHQIKISYDKDILEVEGFGDTLIQNKIDKIKYNIIKKKEKINFSSSLKISKNLLILDFLNFKKKKNSDLEIYIKGIKTTKEGIILEEVSLEENNNSIKIINLLLANNYKINYLEKIDLDYLDKQNFNNKFYILKKNNNYFLKGYLFNADKLIDDLLNPDTKSKKNLFNNNFRVDIDIAEVYFDKDNLLKKFDGYLIFKDNQVYEANLKSNFSKEKKIIFTVRTNGDEKVTTLFTDIAKPIVKRYEFIKGFDDGTLDFFSVEKNNTSNSTLKIYDFKLKELPALTKVLTLASLQGIADVLSGEGIRFKDFEMNFTNKNKIITINEIYAIGPAISIMMNGYVEKNKLISLRGTLVPATTINKTIAAIPLIGDILVGKKIGEGVFGVSFKIKGPPGKTQTSVNPIKSLTPRFITRTLEKIKN